MKKKYTPGSRECVYCGGEADINDYHSKSDNSRRYYVFCYDCGKTQVGDYGHPERAWEEWNKGNDPEPIL